MTPIEVRLFRGMAKRAAVAAPFLVAAAFFLRGPKGAFSVGLAVGLVVGLFALAAYPSTWAARVSPELLGITVVAGFVIRLAAFATLLLLLQNRSFVDKPLFVGTFVLSYLGLLALETRAWVKQRPRSDEVSTDPGTAPQPIGAESG